MRSFRWAFSILIFFGASLSCTKSKNEGKINSKRADFVVALPSDPITWDWTQASDSSSMALLDNLAPRLLKYKVLKDEKNRLKLSEGLIKKWNQKGRILSLELNELSWSDGVLFKASHVLDTFRRIQQTKIQSPCKEAMKLIEKVRVLSSQKIEIQLINPTQIFVHNLTKLCFSPVRRDLILKNPQKWSQPENLVVLGDWVARINKNVTSGIWLERFRNRKKNSILSMEFLSISEPRTALDLYKANRLDFVMLLNSADFEEAKRLAGFFQAPLFMSTFLVLNPHREPFNSKSFRQSILSHVNSTAVAQLMGGARRGHRSYIPKELLKFEWQPKVTPKKSSIKYRKPIQLLVHNSSVQKVLAESIQHQLKKILNLNVQIQIKDWKGYISTINSGAPPAMFRMAWAAQIDHPLEFLQIWTSHSTMNRIGWKSQKYDGIINKLFEVGGGQMDQQLISKALTLLIEEEALIIPLLEEDRAQILRPIFSGYIQLPMHNYDFTLLEK